MSRDTQRDPEHGAASSDVTPHRRKGTDESSTRVWKAYPSKDDGLEHTVVGDVKVLEGVTSPQLHNERHLLVYLPPSYASGSRRYPVVYMHDGQNLFDSATSFGEEWQVDQTLEAASRDGFEVIVVGIPNMGGERVHEYSPFADSRRGGGKGDRYLDFLIDTVKPIVDADFRTLPARAATGIAGSSMGGLISLYAFFRRSETFGFASVMSPALWFAGRAILDVVGDAPLVEGRLYLDVGTREGAVARVDVTRLRDMLVRKGYRNGRDLLCVVDRGAGHDERAWAKRLRRALQFLLGGATAGPSSPVGADSADSRRSG